MKKEDQHRGVVASDGGEEQLVGVGEESQVDGVARFRGWRREEEEGNEIDIQSGDGRVEGRVNNLESELGSRVIQENRGEVSVV